MFIVDPMTLVKLETMFMLTLTAKNIDDVRFVRINSLPAVRDSLTPIFLC